MKKIFQSIILAAFLLSFSGCFKANKNSSEILSDLEMAGFKAEVTKTFDNLSKLTGTSDYDTSCTIINKAEFDKRNIYDLNVICENSDFKISYDLKATYVKNDGWDFSDYDVVKTSSKMKSEISEERILNDISEHFAQYGKTVNIVDESVLQELNDHNIGCKVTADGDIVRGILTVKSTINISYSFYDKWNIYLTYTPDSYEWDLQSLAGKKWIESREGYHKGDFIYIESIDETTSTMMFGYRDGFFASTVDGQPIKCNYELKEDCIKIMDDHLTWKIDPEMGTSSISGFTIYPEN